MGTLAYYIRIYFLIASQYMKARMQYRADFIISLFGMLLINISGFFTFWILFHSITSFDGWSYYDIIFIYAFSLLALTPQQLFFDNLWNLNTHLILGTFTKYYFKPLNIMFYYISEVFDIKGLGQLVFGVVILIYASIKLEIEWSFVKILLLAINLFSSSLIMISIMILSASLGFWVSNTASLLDFVFRFRDFVRYPITIFNGFFRFIFTFVIPTGFIAFYPSKIFLRQGEFDILMYFSPIVGVALFIVAYKVWSRGVNCYLGTGS